MTVLTPLEKGDRLERAVRAIEEAILNASPSLRDRPFAIESKKTVVIDGVRHELDLFVTVDLAREYKSIFIFECKNQQEAVGKNEIIVFSEKINAVAAQRGFFVARSYSRDAEAQAKKDPRIKLLVATEHDPAGLPVPFDFHFIVQNETSARVEFHERGSVRSQKQDILAASARFRLRGEDIEFEPYVRGWTNEVSKEGFRRVPSATLPEGTYDHTVTFERTFADGEFTIDGRDMEWGRLHLTFKYRVYRPAILTHFEVATRGRTLSFAPLFVDGTTLVANISET